MALVALALVLAACGDGETAADDTAGEAIVEDAVGETEPVEGSDEGDEPDDTGSEETAAEGAEPDDGGGSEDAAAVDSGELSVEIDCPPTIVLNEQMLCDIISTGAVSGEWRLPGFTEEPIEMETVPGNNGIFVEPTNPAFVGAWFTLTAEVTSADGETAIDQHRFTIESSAANATLIDDLNTVTTSTPINFASGSAQIESGDVPALDRVVALLVAAPDATIEVGGHTDDDGDDAANQALSEARAQAVVDYFVASGVNPQQVQAAGYGETQPIADNATAEGKAANRRIEFRESGGSPFITIDCPVEFVLGVETRCDIVTANATDGGWRIDGFTDGDVGLATIPGTNEIFIQPTNPAAVGGTFVIEVTVTDAAGQVARQDHTFTIVAE
ncbi:MAG: OmpA family protein [Actinomycetota bacterium]